jgi:hypothetical protein
MEDGVWVSQCQPIHSQNIPRDIIEAKESPNNSSFDSYKNIPD